MDQTLDHQALRALNEEAYRAALREGRTRLTSTPLYIQLEATSDCNLACPSCPRTYWDESINPIGHMSPEVADRMAGFLARASDILLFGVGESVLAPTFPELVRRVRRHAPETSVTLFTNGVALNEKRVDMVLEAGLTSLFFSIDAVDETLFRERRTGSFQRFCRNIEMLRTRQAELGLSAPQLSGSFTATRQNIHELDAVVRFSAEQGFKSVTVIIARIYEASQREDSLFSDQAGIQLARDALARAKAIGEALGVSVDCSTFSQEPLPVTCFRPFACMLVKWNGDIRLCSVGAIYMKDPVYIEIGNLFQTPIEELWNSDYAQQVRRGFFEREHMDPICLDCPLNEMTIETLSLYKRMPRSAEAAAVAAVEAAPLPPPAPAGGLWNRLRRAIGGR